MYDLRLHNYGSNERLLKQIGQELIDPAVQPLVRLRSYDKAKGAVSQS
jgi:hypothetical protein